MAKMRIKKGDLVQVITGRKQDKGGDRGKQGKVIDVFPETQRVLVEGINRVTKHTRAGQTGSEIVVYDDAPHGFHADYRASYAEADAKDGWSRLTTLFAAKLKG